MWEPYTLVLLEKFLALTSTNTGPPLLPFKVTCDNSMSFKNSHHAHDVAGFAGAVAVVNLFVCCCSQSLCVLCHTISHRIEHIYFTGLDTHLTFLT